MLLGISVTLGFPLPQGLNVYHLASLTMKHQGSSDKSLAIDVEGGVTNREILSLTGRAKGTAVSSAEATASPAVEEEQESIPFESLTDDTDNPESQCLILYPDSCCIVYFDFKDEPETFLTEKDNSNVRKKIIFYNCYFVMFQNLKSIYRKWWKLQKFNVQSVNEDNSYAHIVNNI